MAKISPTSIKYMIHASFVAEGALEKPDVIGAIFGQTEGLLGTELEMRELQKEGKIGRIEVDIKRENKRTTGVIKIPTALDQTETTLIAAAVETIEKIGPSDSQIEIDKIEDVRGSKREYIVERAKKLMQNISGVTDSREISAEIRESMKVAGIKEYGKSRLSSGDISGNEVIVVEGRADVLNLVRNGINNVISMNGTKLPEEIKELSKEKELTLFVDGDRGGKLIVQNVADNADIKYVAFAPDGKEVEELTGKEIWMQLRKKLPLEEFLRRNRITTGKRERNLPAPEKPIEQPKQPEKETELDEESKEKLKGIVRENEGTKRAVLLGGSLEEMKKVSVRGLSAALKKIKPSFIVIDGTATVPIINAAENTDCKAIVAKNFATTDTKIQLLSF
jgi:DNA primase